MDDSSFLLDKNTIRIDGEIKANSRVNELLIDPPNKKFLGIPFEILIWNLAKENPDSAFNNWLSKNEKRKKRWEKLLSSKQLRQLKRYKNTTNEWIKSIGSQAVVLDSSKIDRNSKRVSQYFKNKGFFDVSITPKVETVSAKKVIVTYDVSRGNQYTLDSITYSIASEELKALVNETNSSTLLKQGDPFDIENFEAERKRLLQLFREEGVYNFQENSLRFTAAIDSTGQDKSIGIEISVNNPQQRVDDSLITKPYRIHQVKRIHVYVESQRVGATLDQYTDSTTYEGIHIYSKGPLKYRPKALINPLFIELDSVYSEQDRLLTYRYFNELENFKYPSITYRPLSDSLPYLESNIVLSPKEKFSLGLDFDLSHSNIQFFGVGLGTSTAIRNFLKGGEILKIGVQSSFGASSNNLDQLSRFFDLFELGADMSLRIPRLLFPFDLENIIQKQMNPKTDVSLGFAVQENIGLDKQYFSASYAINWEPKEKQKMTFELAGIEFVNNKNRNNYFNVYRNSYDRLTSLAQLYNTNPELVDANNNLLIPSGTEAFFEQAFSQEGIPNIDTNDYALLLSIRERQQRLTVNNLIVGSSFSFNSNTQQSLLDDNFSQFRFKLEWIGNLFNGFLNWTGSERNENGRFDISGVEPSQYFKAEVDYIKHFRVGTERVLALRSFVGMALPYGNANSIPFVRSYFAGGTNDNRAWKAYRLGPGSSQNQNEFNEANFKLAANVEYRFPLFGNLKGALFVDAGNIWNLWDNVQDPASKWEGWQDLEEIAIGSGFGLRYDFDFFVFRFDTAFKTYNPVLPKSKRWGSEYALNKAVFNVGINYPF